MSENKDNKSNYSEEIFANVLIKDKKFKIFCGDGRQKLRWLTDVAILKLQKLNEERISVAYGIKLENGEICNLNENIANSIKNNENVWVLLREEYDVMHSNYDEFSDD